VVHASGEYFYSFRTLYGGNQRSGCAEYAAGSGVVALHRASRHEAFKARTAGQDVHRHAAPSGHAAVDPRHTVLHAPPVYQLSRGQVVGAVHDEIRAGQYRVRVVHVEPARTRLDLYLGVDTPETVSCGHRLARAYIVFIEKALALQVAQLD